MKRMLTKHIFCIVLLLMCSVCKNDTQTKKLVEDKEFRLGMSRKAYDKIFDIWNPDKSTHRLVEIIEAILNKTEFPIFEDGPCSKAEVLKHNWYKG